MIKICLIIVSCCVLIAESSLPVVLWHGMGDSCCNAGSLGKIISVLKSELPESKVYSLRFGDSVLQDIESGYFLNINKQVEMACEAIASNEDLRLGYNAIGFSQGAQFLRAVAQRCPAPQMANLISIGGQHQGIYGLPKCAQPNNRWCDKMRRILNHGAYLNWVQNFLVQAQYWHDPLNEEEYRDKSIFLADINNEKEFNYSYVDNLNLLTKLVLVKFENDTMVNPRESSWFGFYAPGQSTEVLPYDQTDLFIHDKIGLQQLFSRDKLEFISLPGDHLQFTIEWFTDVIINRFLRYD